MADSLLKNDEPVKEKEENLEVKEKPAESNIVYPNNEEKPEYLEDMFWDSENKTVLTDALIKSYNELKDSVKEEKVVENAEDYYDETIGTQIKKDDPLLQIAFNAAKDAGLSVEKTRSFIVDFLKNVEKLPKNDIDTKKELEKLGPDAEFKVSGIKLWIEHLKDERKLNDEVYEAILRLGETAGGIKALDMFRKEISGELDIPVGQTVVGGKLMSLDDWYAATYENSALPGESVEKWDKRMMEIGEKLVGKGPGTPGYKVFNK